MPSPTLTCALVDSAGRSRLRALAVRVTIRGGEVLVTPQALESHCPLPTASVPRDAARRVGEADVLGEVASGAANDQRIGASEPRTGGVAGRCDGF